MQGSKKPGIKINNLIWFNLQFSKLQFSWPICQHAKDQCSVGLQVGKLLCGWVSGLR